MQPLQQLDELPRRRRPRSKAIVQTRRRAAVVPEQRRLRVEQVGAIDLQIHELEDFGTLRLAEFVFVRPYCSITHVAEAGLAKRQTTSSYLKQLATIGVLREHKVGREKLFLHPAFTDLPQRD